MYFGGTEGGGGAPPPFSGGFAAHGGMGSLGLGLGLPMEGGSVGAGARPPGGGGGGYGSIVPAGMMDTTVGYGGYAGSMYAPPTVVVPPTRYPLGHFVRVGVCACTRAERTHMPTHTRSPPTPNQCRATAAASWAAWWA